MTGSMLGRTIAQLTDEVTPRMEPGWTGSLLRQLATERNGCYRLRWETEAKRRPASIEHGVGQAPKSPAKLHRSELTPIQRRASVWKAKGDFHGCMELGRVHAGTGGEARSAHSRVTIQTRGSARSTEYALLHVRGTVVTDDAARYPALKGPAPTLSIRNRRASNSPGVNPEPCEQ